MDATEHREHEMQSTMASPTAAETAEEQHRATWINLSQSSISSDVTTPLTPTFSIRAHGRMPSNGSSLASSPAMRESLDGFGKRPLTEVREEEPQHERNFNYDMFSSQGLQTEDNDLQADYDWVDSPYIDSDFEFVAAKRSRIDEGSDLSSRLKTLSRKWTLKKDKRISSLPESFHESIASRSRANSIKAPSVSDLRAEIYPLPTPNQSFFIEEHPGDATVVSMQTSRTSRDLDASSPTIDHDAVGTLSALPDEAHAEQLTRTPLLPPVMTALRRDEEPVQSPLQSPKVVSLSTSPRDSPALPYHGLPSPPLSTKPSTSSFHRVHGSLHAHNRAAAAGPSHNIVPSNEIPSMLLADTSDEWGIELGHANFSIQPEPYDLAGFPVEPANPAAALRRLEADWRMARKNFDHHLATTREFYGAKSRITINTCKKWDSIDSRWRRLHDDAKIAAERYTREEHFTAKLAAAAEQAEKQQKAAQTWGNGNMVNAFTPAAVAAAAAAAKLPPLDIARCHAKFPLVNPENFVGPMERIVRPEAAPRPTRKRAFWRFLQGILPESVAFGRASN